MLSADMLNRTFGVQLADPLG